jgi:hypothetical protein
VTALATVPLSRLGLVIVPYSYIFILYHPHVNKLNAGSLVSNSNHTNVLFYQEPWAATQLGVLPTILAGPLGGRRYCYLCSIGEKNRVQSSESPGQSQDLNMDFFSSYARTSFIWASLSVRICTLTAKRTQVGSWVSRTECTGYPSSALEAFFFWSFLHFYFLLGPRLHPSRWPFTSHSFPMLCYLNFVLICRVALLAWLWVRQPVIKRWTGCTFAVKDSSGDRHSLQTTMQVECEKYYNVYFAP